MLSYRHAFHAGNHADVLKHAVLVQLLKYLNQKEAPYWVVDTHAGAGRYLLDSDHATKTGEFAGGIGKLWQRDDAPPLLVDYLALVRSMNRDGRLRHYPGSPWITSQISRQQDRLRLFELHSTDIRLLERTFARDATRVAIRHADGFHEIKSVLPPPPRRGLTLIDPAYEDKRDYLRVVMTLKEALHRFATGMYAIWYPMLPRGDARQLPEKLRKMSDKWLDVSLRVQAPAHDGYGMHGSGMFIVNPPWTLADTLRRDMPWLCDALAIDANGGFDLATNEG